MFVNHSMAMGGIETMILNLAIRMRDFQLEPEIAVFKRGGSLESAIQLQRIPFHSIERREGFDLRAIWRLRLLIQRRDIATVHSHNYLSWLYCGLALSSMRGIVHVHTEHSEVEPRLIRYAAELFLSTRTDHVVAVSEHVRLVMTKTIRINPARISLILNGVNTLRFSPNLERRHKMRASLGLLEADIVIGIVARLAPIKNHSQVFQAVALLASKTVTNIRLIVVGDGIERAKLEAEVDALGIRVITRFLGERSDTECLFDAMDIYTLCSLNEGMNLTLLEAMSAGLPVVATAVGGNTEIVAESVSGFLVPVGDVETMYQRLALLANDSKMRHQFGAHGRTRVQQLFDERYVSEQYARLYKLGR